MGPEASNRDISKTHFRKELEKKRVRKLKFGQVMGENGWKKMLQLLF